MSDKILFLGMSFVIIVLALSLRQPPEPEEVAASPSSVSPATEASAVAGQPQALQDAILCLEMAFVVCEQDGQVPCGISFDHGCWFDCCKEVRGE